MIGSSAWLRRGSCCIKLKWDRRGRGEVINHMAGPWGMMGKKVSCSVCIVCLSSGLNGLWSFGLGRWLEQGGLFIYSFLVSIFIYTNLLLSLLSTLDILGCLSICHKSLLNSGMCIDVGVGVSPPQCKLLYILFTMYVVDTHSICIILRAVSKKEKC